MVIYKLIAVQEAQDNGDGTVTLAKIVNAIYPGGTNQAKIGYAKLGGVEVPVIIEYI